MVKSVSTNWCAQISHALSLRTDSQSERRMRRKALLKSVHVCGPSIYRAGDITFKVMELLETYDYNIQSNGHYFFNLFMQDYLQIYAKSKIN